MEKAPLLWHEGFTISAAFFSQRPINYNEILPTVPLDISLSSCQWHTIRSRFQICSQFEEIVKTITAPVFFFFCSSQLRERRDKKIISCWWCLRFPLDYCYSPNFSVKTRQQIRRCIIILSVTADNIACFTRSAPLPWAEFKCVYPKSSNKRAQRAEFILFLLFFHTLTVNISCLCTLRDGFKLNVRQVKTE